MRASIVVLSLGLALTAGCSASNDEPGDATSSSAGASESASDGASDDASGDSSKKSKGSDELNFRPLLAVRQAAAPAPAEVPEKLAKAFTDTDCSGEPEAGPADEPAVACDTDGRKYALGPAVGSGVSAAQAVDFKGDWVVSFKVDEATQEALTTFDEEDEDATAVVFERKGQVLDVRSVGQLVQSGRSTIAGDLDEDSAGKLAEDLRPAS